MTQADPIARVRQAFDAAITASMPDQVMGRYLASLSVPPTAILAIGKAAGPMAQACRDAGLDAKGVLITHDVAVDVDGFDTYIGGHPVPDTGSLEAAEAAQSFLRALKADDHLLVLMSGGGSALMSMPAPGLDLDDKRQINDALLKSGYDIHRMNIVRRLVSAVKGGRLARLAAPAKITQWVMSDVPETGDAHLDLSGIASGPFVGDPTRFDDAYKAISDLGVLDTPKINNLVMAIKDDPALGPVRLGDPVLDAVKTEIIASNTISRMAAAQALGSASIALPDLEGDAAKMGEGIAQLVMKQPEAVVAVTGGETVVSIDANQTHGLGGRSQELALAFLIAMSEYAVEGRAMPKFALLAGGTDGRDGPTDAAGAMVTHEMMANGETLNTWRDALMRHDSYPVLDDCGALIKIPPTGTNLGDVLILKTW